MLCSVVVACVSKTFNAELKGDVASKNTVSSEAVNKF